VAAPYTSSRAGCAQLEVERRLLQCWGLTLDRCEMRDAARTKARKHDPGASASGRYALCIFGSGLQ
jgi:hypothetical protein